MTIPRSNCSTSALWEAVFSGDVYSLKKVLKTGVNPNVLGYDGEPLLFTPIVHGDLEILKVFLTYCDVNIESKDGRTALMLAIQMDDMEMVKALIKAGASLDFKDHCGTTPLLLALQDGRFKIAEQLVKYGSDVNAEDDDDQSALCLILKGNNKNCAKIIKILFDSGYIMKESDRVMFLQEHLFADKNRNRKYLKLIQKLQIEVDYEEDDISDVSS